MIAVRPVVPLALLLSCGVAAAELTVFRGVDVLPMDRDTVLRDHTVVVRGEVIEAVGPRRRVEVPEGARVVEGRGLWLMPGLAEAHGHLQPLDHPDLQPTLDLFLAHGVTTVRGLLGETGQLVLRQQLQDGERDGPRVVLAGPSLNGNSVTDPEQAAALVGEIHQAGFDLLKIHPGLDIPRFDAVMAAARAHGMPVVGHVPEAVGLMHALDRRMAGIEHMDDYVRALVPDDHRARTASPGFFGLLAVEAADPDRIPVLVEATRAAGTAISPTETLMRWMLGGEDVDDLLARPEMVYVPGEVQARWRSQRGQIQSGPGFSRARADRFLDLRRQLLKALHDGGVPIVLGSDAPQWFNVPGVSAHRELALMVEAGLTPWQALRTGTVAAAAHLGAAGERGAVAAGQAADLVLLDADPRRRIGRVDHIRGVMVAGRWHDRADLDARLAALRARAAALP
ncbi:MAG: amidohydrolase family protein [Pseudoxanthomonas sp.]|nr:amidohydrolase family protein [Pseudoxanthomonas sp.]